MLHGYGVRGVNEQVRVLPSYPPSCTTVRTIHFVDIDKTKAAFVTDACEDKLGLVAILYMLVATSGVVVCVLVFGQECS